jgi:hypothetical protein
LAASRPKDAVAPAVPGTGPIVTSFAGSMPAAFSISFSPSTGPGAAPMRRFFTEFRFPLEGLNFECKTRNQYMCWASAQSSLPPRQFLNA